MQTIRVILAGPRGRMGREAVSLMENTPHFELVGAVDYKHGGTKLRDIEGMPALAVPVYDTLEACLQEIRADVLLDLTNPETGKLHIHTALKHNLRSVIGTTGFTEEEIANLTATAEEKKVGTIIAPNFAVGAVLMMKFARMAAKYFNDVEIIELHHDQKLDAPSGTALKTVDLIRSVRQPKQQGHPSEVEQLPGARGAELDGIRVHSVRLPGLIAHQEVLFGGDGQMLTIRHDSFNRASFMSGVQVAIETVMGIETLVYGLENIID
ncbi:4-hydroxy-tetrahydrodipicolinate reductase [Ectobacillus sp. JY-23]|uniref:4-hydroxy-tetrahydrodipicolinate reductase n=1 Tax=Ectobacillus sp. JY-23 TaxID=2933872 RepID=UPI001FF5A84B|nr:4-hydroxy-tetrahydrodipicolinate reductase [Ectobacillus sp. JY-23]UOY93452.1 4-hydroxy-tetrahydrodipicolinate reductase [Ectobacillus sp. JY-23]